MGKVTAAHLLVRTLKRHGIERIFGLCGDHVNSIFNACIDEGVAGKRIDFRLAYELGEVRYDRVVAALGGHGEHVEHPAELRPALDRALKAGRVACVNVRMRGMASPLTTANIARTKAASR